MAVLQWFSVLLLLIIRVYALRYDPSQIAYNINTNQTADGPIDYWGEWENHTFNPSPSNWRLPFYTVLLDRFANGNPKNDDANETQFEHDLTQTQLRHGGDIKGLQDSLDYLQGMGTKVGLTACSKKLDALLTRCRFYTSQAARISTSLGQQMDTAPLILHSLTIILGP